MADRDTSEGKVRISIWMPRGQHAKLKKIGEHEGRSVTDLIRQQVGDFLRARYPEPTWTEEHVGSIPINKEED